MSDGRLENPDVKLDIIDKEKKLYLVFSDDGKNIKEIKTFDGRIFFPLEYFRNLPGNGVYLSYVMGGYIEERGEDGIYKMYKIETINGLPYQQGLLKFSNEIESVKIGKGPEIKFTNPEYFTAWENISFAMSSMMLNSDVKGEVASEKLLNLYLLSGSLRIKHLKRMLGNGNINQQTFDDYKGKVLDKLVEQITDERFWKFNDPVTKQELESYRIYFVTEPEKFQILMDAYYDFHGVTQEQREKERDVLNWGRKTLERLRNPFK